MEFNSLNFDTCWKLFGFFSGNWVMYIEDAFFFTYNIIDYNWTRQKVNEKYITKR